MNILYINHYAGSADMGMEFRPYYLSREWVKMGHKVTVLAGDYSHLRVRNPQVSRDFQREMIDGIEYVWLKTGEYSGNGVARAKTMARFVEKLRRYSKAIVNKWHPDVVIASSTYPLDTYAAQRIAKLSGAKYIHEVHDMWPATLYEVGGMSKLHPFVVAMQIAENSAYKHCDKCVALLPYSKKYMMKHGLAPEKFINIQNGVSEDEWTDFEKIPDEHREFFEKNKGKFVVGYFGGHALSNALDWSLDVAKDFQNKEGYSDVIFVFVGEGVEKERLMERAKEEKIDNAYFLPSVNKKMIPDLLTYFDCSYMTGMNSPLYRYGLCLNKMYDSMMAGLPIVCAYDAPDTLVKRFNCGYQCDPADKDEVVKAISNIVDMKKEERRIMGEKGKKAVKKYFTYNKIAEKFEKCF